MKQNKQGHGSRKTNKESKYELNIFYSFTNYIFNKTKQTK